MPQLGASRMLQLDAGIGASRGDAVIALLERAQVPPVPPFYKLCYDYLAGEKTLDAIRAGAILEDGANGHGEGARTAGELLYEDFVAPYENQGTITQVVGTMIARIGALEKLMAESQEANRSQAAELAGATEHLGGDDIDAALLREWILRLQATNLALQRANDALSAELDQTLEVVTNGQDELAALSRAATLDPLTGVANRAGLDQALGEVFAEVAPNARLSLAVVDVDHFKQLNDTYGHQIGDEILRLVGRALITSTRENDIMGRTGGDEFLVIIRDEDLAGARIIAERIRRAVVDCDLTRILGKGVVGNVTASIGVAQFHAGDTLAKLYDRADKCLFEAKQRGRNQTVVEQPPGKQAA